MPNDGEMRVSATSEAVMSAQPHSTPRRARRVVAATLVALVLIVGAVLRVDFESYDGCNWFRANQPALLVPISLLTKEPLAESSGRFTTRGCQGGYGERAFKVGPFGSVPEYGTPAP